MINRWHIRCSGSGKWLMVGALAVSVAAAPIPRAPAQGGEDESAAGPAGYVGGSLNKRYDEHLGWIVVADPLGHVDGSRMRELAGPEGLMREVSLRGPMLKILARTYAKRGKEAMAALLSGLDSIEAVLTEPKDEDFIEFSQGMASFIELELKREGWVRIAAVRTNEVDVNTYVLIRDDEIRGLTILVESKPGQFVFVNLAGHIELDQLSLLNEALDIPVLDAGTAAIEQLRALKADEPGTVTSLKTDGQRSDQRSQNKPNPNGGQK